MNRTRRVPPGALTRVHASATPEPQRDADVGVGPSTYYAAIARPNSTRAVPDGQFWSPPHPQWHQRFALLRLRPRSDHDKDVEILIVRHQSALRSFQHVVVEFLAGDQNPAFHRSARDVENPDIRFGQSRLGVLGADPGDQLVAVYTDRRVAVGEEGDPAEHPLLAQPGRGTEVVADPVGQYLVIGRAGMVGRAAGVSGR